MTAAQAVVLAVIYLCGLVFLIVAVARLRKRYESGVIHGPDLCYSYPYTMGDNLGWNRHGLDVWLPENLPEFYIVSYASKSVKGATYVLKNAWRIELEGEFGQKFGVYFPCNNAAEVLSIITPDVMRSLLAYAQDFDIHVEGGTMHVISRWRVYENSKRKQRLLLAAHSFVAEIDHKLKSWSPHTQTNVRMVKGLEGSLMLGGARVLDIYRCGRAL